MITAPRKIGIIGIGNLLLADEGFGVHLLHHLEDGYQFPETVQLMDAGTASIYMAPFIEAVECLFVIDVVDLKDSPGSIHCFTGDEVRAGKIQTKMSPHQLGLLEMMEICALRGKVPDELQYICVVPQHLDTGLELSPLLTAKIPEVVAILLEKLKRRGVTVTRKNRLPAWHHLDSRRFTCPEPC